MKNFIQIGPYCYRVQDTLGEGSSSKVYKGYRLSSVTKYSSHHECFAIKEIKNQIDVNLIDIEQELKILYMFREQQGVVKLLDVIYKNNKIYIVTQLCEGGTLKNLIKKKGSLSQQQAIEYFKQLVIGYESLYKKSIVHRDIKPTNILLKDQKIKIADFGFAANQQQLQKQTLRVGSPLYMPYQTLKNNIYSYKGDMWALGITLYEMITGEVPFKSINMEELLSQMTNFYPRQKIPVNISIETITLIERLLKIDPKQRLSFIALKNLLFTTPFEKKMNSPMKNTVYISKQQKSEEKESNLILKARNSESPIKNPESPDLKHRVLQTKSKRGKSFFDMVSMDIISNKQIQKLQNGSKMSKVDHQKIFDELLSQIHLIRFMFKIWQLLKENKQFAYNWILQNYLIGAIFFKLDETQKLNLLSQSQAQSFCQTEYCQKLLQICKRYHAKYSSLSTRKNLQNPTIAKLLKLLPSELTKIYKKIKEQILSEQIKSKSIISLDFLITLYQLLNLLDKKGYEQFHSISKIQKIASMQNVTNVNDQHFSKITTKMVSLKLI